MKGPRWQALAAAAAHGLDGTTLRPPDAPLGDDDWRAVFALARFHRLWGLLAAAIGDGAFPVTPAQEREAADAHRAAMAETLALERLLLRTVEVLDVAGIDHRVLKGPALAHTVYADPSLRAFGDVDVIVPSARLGEAGEALAAAGMRRERAQLRPGFDRRFAKATPFIAPGGSMVDLHRSLVTGRFGLTVDNNALFATASTFEVGGKELRALGAEERFLAACYHAALGDKPLRFLSLRDLVQTLAADDLSLSRARRISASWRGDAVVAHGVALAWEHLGLRDSTPLVEWARRHRPRLGERLALRTTGSNTTAAHALLGVGVVPGFRGKAAYLGGILLPDRGALDARHGSYLGWWKQGARSLLRWGRRR